MTELKHNKTGISIQVGLSGYSFKVYDSEKVESSPWMKPEQIFSSPQMQKRYDEVEISMFTHKFTLVSVTASFFKLMLKCSITFHHLITVVFSH